MKIALVCPGQGSQHVGMGRDLYYNFAEVRELYALASDTLGYDLASLSFDGPADELDRTFRTQPLLLTASYAAFTMMQHNGITPSLLAGHSLGEYSAVTAAGVMSFADALKVTEQRGTFMQEAVPEGEGLMAAVIGLERDKLQNICDTLSSGYAAPANFNCPGQIVIAGEAAAVKEAMKMAEEAGARRAIPLKVSVPSHCRLMEPASGRLAGLLDEIQFADPIYPIVNNADATILDDAQSVKLSLVRQLNEPLLWEDSVRLMMDQGIDTVIETGPKTVLSGLIKRIDRNIRLLNVEDSESLQQTLKALEVS